jgi:hypothetical protein
MGKIPEATRKLINDYYSRPGDMSMGQFCRANKIKVYYLKRVLELYGQKLMPVLRDLSAYSAAIYDDASNESLDELWKESRKFIAAEVSDQERVRLKTPSQTSIEFERIRFRLLIDIAMMPYSTKSDKAIRFAQKAVDHVCSC